MTHDNNIDRVTGVATTGHVWDGDLKELNKPLPRWWLYTFYATIVWGIGYCIAYPAWPTLTSYTTGVLGYNQRTAVTIDIAEGKADQERYLTAIGETPLDEISKHADLANFARAGGAAVFGTNCSGCHGRAGQGAKGYPNLLDDDWLWGGTLADIQATIVGGIRSGHPEARDFAMPRFGLDQILTPAEIGDAAEYVLTLSGKSTDAAAAKRGAEIFAAQCAACHGESGTGNQAMGAPNLTDPIWLYGGEKANVAETITTGRGGVMPSWDGRLDPATIKMLAVYVHGLGGGQ